MIILATGATGALGPHVIKALTTKAERIYLLVRKESLSLAKTIYAEYSQIECLEGDLSNPDLIADSTSAKKIQAECDVIIHMAALYNLKASYKDCFLHNVVGTQNVLFFATECSKKIQFHYLSTVAVAGDFKGDFLESQLELGQKFTNHYAKSKYEAEVLVRHWKHDGPVFIHRLGILTGHSQSGEFNKIDGIYYFLKALHEISSKRLLINLLKYLPMPYSKQADLPLIPIDRASLHVVDSIGLHFKNKSDQGVYCYNVVSEEIPKVGTFIQDSFDAMGFKINIVPLPETPVNELLMEKVGLPRELLEYLYSGAHFPREQMFKDHMTLDLGRYTLFKDVLFKKAKAVFSSKRGAKK